MPSGPKKRRAERKKNVLLQVKIEEGLDVKMENVPVEVNEPVAVKIEPVSVEVYEPVVEPIGPGHVEPVVEPIGAGRVEPALVSQVEPVPELPEPVVSLVEPVAESYEPMVGLVEPLAESSMALVGLPEPELESEPVVESSVNVANSTNSCEGIDVVDNGDELLRKGSDQVNGKKVDQPPPTVVDVEENGLVKKCLINAGVKVTTKVELEDVKKTIEEQLRVIDQVTVNLRQILASLD